MKLTKKTKKAIGGLIVLVLAIGCAKYGIDLAEYEEEISALTGVDISEGKPNSKEEKVNLDDLGTYKVVRVVDGDTFIINYNGKEERVRLIGVDTPESVHPNEEKNTAFGKKVSNFSKEKLTNKEVQIEFDVSQRDKYGRLLCYVYVDGQMYNKLLLEEGLAKVATYPPNIKYVEDFTKIQKEARENKKGMWQDEFNVDE